MVGKAGICSNLRLLQPFRVLHCTIMSGGGLVPLIFTVLGEGGDAAEQVLHNLVTERQEIIRGLDSLA